MADDQNPKIVFDVDTKEAIDSVLNLKNNINDLGSVEGISGILEQVKTFGVALGLAGAAVFAFKEAFDLVQEAENIQRIQNQFDQLTESVDLNSAAFKQQLEDASKGLIDETTLMSLANKAIVQMGDSAARLPEIMELAAQATKVFGGDLQGNFQNLEQAIMRGSARQLKMYGVTLDTTQAIKDYANATGIAVDTISKEGKQQIIMNAALDATKEAMSGVASGGKTTTNTITEMSVALKEMGEAFAIFFNSVFGPMIKAMATAMKNLAVDMKNGMQALFGDATQKMKAQLSDTENSIQRLKDQMARINESKSSEASKASWAVSINNQIESLEKKAAGLKGKLQEAGGYDESDLKSKAVQLDVVDSELAKNQKIKFELEYQKVVEANAKAREAMATDGQVALQENFNQQIAMQEQYELRKKQLEDNPSYSPQQKLLLQQQLYEQFYLSIQQMQEQTLDIQLKAADELSKKNRESADAIANNFEAGAKRAKIQFKDMANDGQTMFNSLNKHSSSAFEAMGRGLTDTAHASKGAAELMRNALLDSLADYVALKGSQLLAQGIGEFNPVEIAAGGSLMALAGVIRGVTGGSGPSGDSSGGGGGAPGTSGPSAAQSTYSPTTQQSLQAQKAVSVTIQGHYLETDATRRQLMEMIRQETDATSFAYNQVGS